MSPGVPAVLIRGGTSKGVFLHARHVPPAGPRRDALVLDLMGSPDPMQIDGLGGTYSSTSKVVVVTRPRFDRPLLVRSSRRRHTDGRLVQELRQPDDGSRRLCGRRRTGPCGRTVTLVVCSTVIPGCESSLRSRSRRSGADHGTQQVAGVPGRVPRSPPNTISWRLGHGPPAPTGSVTNALDMPDGPLTVWISTSPAPTSLSRPPISVSFRGPGLWLELNGDRPLLDESKVRGEAARLIGTVSGLRGRQTFARRAPYRLVAPTQDLATADLEVVAVSMGAVHRALPMTAALCLAAAARIPGTVVQANAGLAGSNVRLAHPLGQVEVVSDLHAGASGIPVVDRSGWSALPGDS